MNGKNFIIDTNIALYLLNGDSTIAALLNDSNIYISFITELELLGYHHITPLEKIKVKALHCPLSIDKYSS